MKLSKKIKFSSLQNRDETIRRVCALITAGWVAVLWLPYEKQTIVTACVLLAVTFTVATVIWMVATAISKLADYTAISVSLGMVAGLFWLAPKTLCEGFIEGWQIQSAGVASLIFEEALIAVLVGLVTAGLRTYYKSL